MMARLTLKRQLSAYYFPLPVPFSLPLSFSSVEFHARIPLSFHRDCP